MTGVKTPIAVSTASHVVLMPTLVAGAPALAPLEALPPEALSPARAPVGVSSDIPWNPDAAFVAGLSIGNASAGTAGKPFAAAAVGGTRGIPILLRMSSLTTIVVPSDLTSTGSCRLPPLPLAALPLPNCMRWPVLALTASPCGGTIVPDAMA